MSRLNAQSSSMLMIEHGGVIAYGRYQGARWRRACILLPMFSMAAIIAVSWIQNDSAMSLLHAITTLGVVAVVLTICYFGFGRRMGVEIQPNGLCLHGALRRTQVPWSHVQGFVWKENRSLTQTEYLHVKTDQPTPRRIPKDAPLRLPTIARVTNADHLNDRLLGSLLTSPNIRSQSGEEVDAEAMLEAAWPAQPRESRASES